MKGLGARAIFYSRYESITINAAKYGIEPNRVFIIHGDGGTARAWVFDMDSGAELETHIEGAILAAALPNLQAKGLALTRVPKVKCVVIIGGAMFQSPAMAEKAYSSKITCPSLHFLGETDFLKKYGEALLESFVDPVVVRHPKGHTVPRLDDKSLELVMNFFERIEQDLHGDTGVDESVTL